MIFGVTGNYKNPDVIKSVSELINLLETDNTDYLLDKKLHAEFKKANYQNVNISRLSDDKQLINNSDFILSFGGDGTMLWTAQMVSDSNKPIIGVNLGKLGFLTETSNDSIYEFIQCIKNGDYNVDERILITAEIEGSHQKLNALNEIVISKAENVQTIDIKVNYKNEYLTTYHADGLIISTPTGSTGYSLSAGGPILYPKCSTFIICPICSHSLTARPIVIPENAVISAEAESRVPIIITADGNKRIVLNKKAKVTLRKADFTIKLLRKKNSYYFNILNKKLLLGEDIRNKKNN